MPVYEYRCLRGHVTEELRTVGLRAVAARCIVCGERAEKAILHAPRVFSDYEGYQSPRSGRWIEGKSARREDLLRAGAIAWEPGIEAQIARTAKANEEREEVFI